jgi:lipopolysaccharide/colanic/teichoic acid biosynthesis glycosyltransferase
LFDSKRGITILSWMMSSSASRQSRRDQQKPPPHERFYARHGKRAVDLLLGSVAVVLLSPFLLLTVLAIKVDSAGPVFFRQERIGRNGRPFQLIKFRSMMVGAHTIGAGVLVEAKDNRVTRIGRLLRRFSIDEIPQIFNVLGGSMSLIGPRPTLSYQVERYDEVQRRRLLVRPGITGWAQVHGRNGIDWDQRIKLDLIYLQRLTLSTDLLVILKTIPVVLWGTGRLAKADYWKTTN